jgi:hypothetical protein
MRDFFCGGKDLNLYSITSSSFGRDKKSYSNSKGIALYVLFVLNVIYVLYNIPSSQGEATC